MNERVALLDVDGTLRVKDAWNPGALELIDDLHRAGIHVALCSGRTTGSLTSIVKDIPHVEFLASSSGATVLQRRGGQWHVLQHTPVPRPAVDRALALATEQGIEVWGFTPREWLIERWSPRSRNEIRHINDEARTATLAEFADDFGKILLLPRTQREEAAVRELGRIKGAVVVNSGGDYTDLISESAHETKGGAAILPALNAEWDDVISMGDSENDHGMLQRAGLAVCMAPLTLEALGESREGAIRLNAATTEQARELLARYI